MSYNDMIYLEKEEQLNEYIKKGLVLVDFYANWCGPCQLLTKELEVLENEVKDLKIVKVDVDKFENIAREYNIYSIPDIKVFKNGKLFKTNVGYMTSEQLKQMLS